jgi:hypothetical protein
MDLRTDGSREIARHRALRFEIGKSAPVTQGYARLRLLLEVKPFGAPPADEMPPNSNAFVGDLEN